MKGCNDEKWETLSQNKNLTSVLCTWVATVSDYKKIVKISQIPEESFGFSFFHCEITEVRVNTRIKKETSWKMLLGGDGLKWIKYIR